MKILYIVQKDLDLKVIERLETLGNEVVTCCFRHRDYLEAKSIGLKNPHSFPSFWKDRAVLPLNWRDDLDAMLEKYDFRSLSRYSFLDVGRSRKPGISFDDDEYLSYLLIKFFVDLNIEAVDFCVGELSKSFNLICYDLCSSLNIEYLHYVGMALEKGMAFTDDEFRLVTLHERWACLGDKQRESLRKIIEEKVEKFVDRPEYKLSVINKKTVAFGELIKRAVKKSSRLALELRSSPVDKKYRLDQVYVNPVLRLFANNPLINFRFRFNKLKWDRIAKKELPEGPFFYYSLHVQPETTTSLFSEFAIDNFSQQGSLIEFLAKQLPPNSKLVVKDHPYMLDKRRASIYEKLASYPQVHFVPPWFDQFEIVKKSSGVITSVGTVGIEGRMLGKPVCVLSNTYYDDLDVFKASSLIDVQEFYASALNKSTVPLSDEELLVLSKIYNCIALGVENFIDECFPGQAGGENVANLTKAIIEEYNFRKTVCR